MMRDDRWTVVGDRFTTTDETLARQVAAELDRMVPLSCDPQCPSFFLCIDCCGSAQDPMGRISGS